MNEDNPLSRLARLVNPRTAARALLVACVLVLLSAAGRAAAEPERIALVVGNQSYESVVQLDNPISDALLMATELRQRGFDVTLLTDARQAEFNEAIRAFGSRLRAMDRETVGLFFYAGHAVQSFGTNYLLPVDISLTDAADLSLVAVRADAVLRQMRSARNLTNILILDACRDNPFVDVPDLDDTGLAEMSAPTGTFMSYSTAPNSVALDGNDGNSPFTAALASQMAIEGLPIEQVFKQVRSAVLEKTNGKQTPWDTSSLTDDFYFTPAAQKTPDEIAQQRFFESLEQTRDPVQMVVFLRDYPGSIYAGRVRKMLAEVLDGAVPSRDPEPQNTASPETIPKPAPRVPRDRELELFEIARASGLLADYEAYLEAYPDGDFAVVAQRELNARGARQAPAPRDDDPAQMAAATAPAREAAEAPPAPPKDPIRFDTPLTEGSSAVIGKSIKTLITGSPLFPPVRGLPESYWKTQQCSNCHQWTKERLCEQARTYLAASGKRALSKEHPYGGSFKRNLRTWASTGCL